MSRMLSHIQIEKPDFCHTTGQTLMQPLSSLFGHSYRVEKTVQQLSPYSLAKRVSIAVFAFLLLPASLLSLTVGSLFLAFSETHKKAYAQIQESPFQVIWNEGKPSIQTPRLLLRPVQSWDLETYQNLFKNPVAMERYLGGPRDITERFHGWVNRWKEDSFSAFAIVDREARKVIGHAVAGHGDYEGDFEKGWSEGAVVLDPAYWNSDFKDEAKGIGTAGKKGIGTEVVRGAVVFAKALKENKTQVPSDVTPEQRPDIEAAAKAKLHLKTHRDEKGLINWVYLPFTELRATALKEKGIGEKMANRVALDGNKVEKRPKNGERDLFAINL